MQPVTLQVSEEKGTVSACHMTAANSVALLVLGHGAGANMHHAHMQQLAEALARQQVETLRFNFPYMERGFGRTDKLEVCLDTIQAAVSMGHELRNSVPVFLGGHSFGGRMASHFAAELATQPHNLKGLVYFSFPLHPSKKPDTMRAEHLPRIQLPQLFVSGTRDTLADLMLLEPIVSSLEGGSLTLIETADHGFKILKRTRQSTEDVYDEAARYVRDFIDAQTN